VEGWGEGREGGGSREEEGLRGWGRREGEVEGMGGWGREKGGGSIDWVGYERKV